MLTVMKVWGDVLRGVRRGGYGTASAPHILVFGVALEEETESGWLDAERV